MKYLLFVLILCCAFPINAQQRSFTPTNAKGETEKRLALVIGNANYQGNILTNPLNDAKAMRTALQELGFTVQYYENLGKTAMEAALMRFSSDLHKHNVGLFYFAGHGFESKDKVNYLMSTDMNSSVNEALAKDKSLNLDVVIQSMQDANVNSNLLVIDACRNNPFRSWSRDGAKGLGSVSPALGTVVFFAASAGQAADDNRGGKNGLFTEEFLSQIRKPNLELSDILKNTSRAVYKRSGGQMPAISGNLLEDFYFVTSKVSPIPQPEVVKPITKVVPSHVSPNPAPVKKTDLLPYEPAMVFVKGGTFQMGSNDGESDEKPVHSVWLENFQLGKTEVTVGAYLAFCDATNSHYPEWLEEGNKYHIMTGTDDHYKKLGYNRNSVTLPIVGVSWYNAVAYTEWLSKQTGKSYRLPTEAEWEYAARGGQTGNGYIYSGSTSLENVGWIDGNSNSKTHEVGSKKSNELGIYDMSGNVYEWCSDWYGAYAASSQTNPTGASSSTNRVLRGGSWYSEPQNSRVAFRGYSTPDDRNSDIGFRVVLSQ